MHSPSGRYYIGSTNNLYLRKAQHLHRLKENLQGAADQLCGGDYHREEFVFHYETFDDKFDALQLEKAMLRSNIGLDLCTNKSYGEGPLLQHTVETRKKVGDARRDIPRTLEEKINISKGKSRKVSLDGIVYDSCYIAAIEFGIGSRALRQRLSATTPRWKNWFFLD